MYVMNLLFDLAKPGDGLFEPSPNPAGPLPAALNCSQTWLRLMNAAAVEVADLGAGIDPAALPGGLHWDIIGPGPLYVPNHLAGGGKHVVGVRIAPKTAGAITAASALEFVASFGAPLPGVTKFASPFDLTGPPDALTTFHAQPGLFAVPDHGWFVKLHTIDKPSPHANIAHRYEFSVGVIITPALGGPSKHFGIDPEMDIGL